MDSIERFKKRKKLQEKLQSCNLYLVSDQELVEKHLNSEIDRNLITKIDNTYEKRYNFQYDIEVSENEVKELLTILENNFDECKFNNLLLACKNNVIQSIITPFGLGSIVANFDKDGGNVNTIHNVRNIKREGIGLPQTNDEKNKKIGIYATNEEKDRYIHRGEYKSSDYHGDRKYILKNKIDAEKQKVGELKDSYTGKILDQKSKRDLDHTISAREIHDDPGRVLAEMDGVELANLESNLHSTERTINRIKKAESVDKFLEDLEKKKNEKENEINKLKSKVNLTEKERKKFENLEAQLEALDFVDHKKMKRIDQKARKEYNKILNKKYYTSKKFIKNTTLTSIEEAGKMGLQQAVGLLLAEFFTATFDELSDIYHHGFPIGDSKFIDTLKIRLKRVAERITNRWKDMCNVFSQGFISGFLSNLVTVIINTFITTGKRIVRIIREGFFSLLRAIKLLCCPPEDFTFLQAAHEASKLIASGLVITGGIILEECIDDVWIKCSVILEPFADIITTILIGSLTGIVSTFIVYAIDKIDFFKVNDKEKHEYIMKELESRLNKMFLEADVLIEELTW